MLLVTTCSLPGYEVREVLGLVSYSTVKARHLGKDVIASLRGIAGGEIREYTELLQQARREALEGLSREAQAMGANAVICVRLATSSISSRMAEVLAYGTAVIVEERSQYNG